MTRTDSPCRRSTGVVLGRFVIKLLGLHPWAFGVLLYRRLLVVILFVLTCLHLVDSFGAQLAFPTTALHCAAKLRTRFLAFFLPKRIRVFINRLLCRLLEAKPSLRTTALLRTLPRHVTPSFLPSFQPANRRTDERALIVCQQEPEQKNKTQNKSFHTCG